MVVALSSQQCRSQAQRPCDKFEMTSGIARWHPRACPENGKLRERLFHDTSQSQRATGSWEVRCSACGTFRRTRARTPIISSTRCNVVCSPTTSNRCQRLAKASKNSGFGMTRHLSSDLHRQVCRCRILTARVSEEDAAHVPTRHQDCKSSIQGNDEGRKMIRLKVYASSSGFRLTASDHHVSRCGSKPLPEKHG